MYKRDVVEFLYEAESLRDQGKNEEAEVYEARVRFVGSCFKDEESLDDMLSRRHDLKNPKETL